MADRRPPFLHFLLPEPRRCTATMFPLPNYYCPGTPLTLGPLLSPEMLLLISLGGISEEPC